MRWLTSVGPAMPLCWARCYEGLPRALVEASALGLPCLVHAYAVSDYALGPHGYSADLTHPGALTDLISSLAESDFASERARMRHAYAYEHFSWDRLRARYIELLLAPRQVDLRLRTPPASWSPS